MSLLRNCLGTLAFGIVACSADPSDPPPAERSSPPPARAVASRVQSVVERLEERFDVRLTQPGYHVTASAMPNGGVRLTAPSAGGRSLALAASVELPNVASGSIVVADVRSNFALEIVPQSLEQDARLAMDAGTGVYEGAAPGGGDVVVRIFPWGMEDYLTFDAPPPQEQLSYQVRVPPGAGLRSIDGLIEVIDASGTPRLRMNRPSAFTADGVRHRIQSRVTGCAVDESPVAPWGRPPTAPGAERCTIEVSWADLSYPLLVDPAWTTTGAMTESRKEHAAALLPVGRVVVASGSGTNPLSADLYDPNTKTWAATGSMTTPHQSPIYGSTPSGKALVGGGRWSGAFPTTTELYDPASGIWSASGALVHGREHQRHSTLSDGRLFVAGGYQDTAEVYDPATGAWSGTAPMSGPRQHPLVVTLADGRVLVAGGFHTVSLKTAEIYDPASNTWSPTTSMNDPHHAGVGVLLADGRVVIAGGFTTASEVYDPSAQTWTSVPDVIGKCNQQAALLPNGRAIVAGGCSGPLRVSQLFDPNSNTWLPGGDMSTPHESGTGTLLADGSFMVTGGFAAAGAVPTDQVDLFMLQADGDPCTRAAECDSGFCVEGVCCSSACTGTCQSCRAANQQAGSDGTCGPVKAGTDPGNDCADDGAPACGNNGSCDGTGACQRYPSAGGCTPNPCTTGAQCASGHCEDGICCDAACGECQACTAAKKGSGVDGVCGPVLADTDPDDECAEGPNFPASCLADGACNGAGACRVFAKSTVACGQTQCVAGNAVGQLCNGAGTCSQATVSCDPYVCANDACLQSCTDGNDCAAGRWCSPAGTCETKVVAGTPCATGVECESAFCADGVCCNSACVGQCEACNIEPNVGACSPVVGDPVGDREPCVIDDAECAGSCDGVNRAACGYPSSETSCGARTCSGGIARASQCNGKGVCVATDDRPCGAYACGDDRCNTTCASADDCAAGYTCAAEGQCVPGSVCSEDLTRTSGPAGEVACAPFLCDESTGRCHVVCSKTTDCATGYVCDGTSKACIPGAQDTAPSEEGCGCRTVGSPAPRSPNTSGHRGLWLWTLAGLLVLRRRRPLVSELRCPAE